MRIRGLLTVFTVVLSALALSSCLLPGMIPLESEPDPDKPMPVMEKDPEAVLEALRGGKFVYLQALAKEQYTDEDFAKPGTLTFTVDLTGQEGPTYFNYGWCTTTEEILQQNFEHIRVRLSLDGRELAEDVVHAITSTQQQQQQDMVCLEFGVLFTDWPPGEYQLEAAATFDETINDGLADFEAGDYVFEYNVTVEK